MRSDSNLLARAGARLASFCERWFPDAFVFALAAIVIVFLGGLSIGIPAAKLASEFGGGFWSLVNFTMQMAIIIVGGFVVASSPPVARLTSKLAAIPRTARGAVAFVAMFAMLSALISWGLSLIFTGLLVRAVVRRYESRGTRVDYRALGAAAYLGLGTVWALGLSSSPALLMATKTAIPPALFEITGVIPLTQTIFLWQSMAMAAILIAVAVTVAYYSAPREHESRTFAEAGVAFEDVAAERATTLQTPADRAENSPILSVLIALLLFWFLAQQLRERGGLAAVDLNNFNLAFVAFGLLLHWRPRSFLRAVGQAVPATAGVLIQFPFYGGIFGMIAKTEMSERLAKLFIEYSTKDSFPVVIAIYSACLDLFLPSGGGKWVVEAPYVMQAAKELGVHLGWTVQVYNVAESVPNLINPFWMLPLMGILGVKARDLAGYSILQLLFLTPLMLALVWVFAKTLS
jgi:short-chain fatty acids transporter